MLDIMKRWGKQMKRVGIITLSDNLNYGNRLQNFAVHHILTQRGYCSESIVCENSRFKHYMHPFTNWIKRYVLKEPFAFRIHSFQRFNYKYIPRRFFFSKYYELPSGFKNNYDYFVTGSDQVWNVNFFIPEKFDGQFDYYFLQFANDYQKICFSPGIGRFKTEYLKMVANALKGYRYLSCREQQGADVLKQITGRECYCLIDPTLFLSKNDWKDALSIKTPEGEPYIFVFFIDGMTEELKSFVEKYASSRYRILDPSDITSPLYSIDPAEFVALLSGAHMVFTDSFHVTAFAINFHVPFYVFNRKKVKNMTSRIESICEMFSLQSRYIHEQEPFPVEEECGFELADNQLLIERKKLSDYLDQCFEG